jgi:hypothetical protein
MKIELIPTILQAIAIISGVVYLVVRIGRTGKTDPAAALKEQQALTELLEGALFGIVTETERTYGSGTGRLKLSAALEKLLALIPDKWKTVLSADFLQGMIEKALTAAKKKWEENPGLVGAAPEESE